MSSQSSFPLSFMKASISDISVSSGLAIKYSHFIRNMMPQNPTSEQANRKPQSWNGYRLDASWRVPVVYSSNGRSDILVDPGSAGNRSFASLKANGKSSP